MKRFSLLILGCLSLLLWMAEMSVPDTQVNVLGERIYLSSIEWITWVGFFAGVIELLEVRKTAHHRRILGEIAGLGLFFVGILALIAGAPLWMALCNLSLSALFILAAVTFPKMELQEQPNSPQARQS